MTSTALGAPPAETTLSPTSGKASRTWRPFRSAGLLGPAFVAALAYVDPGNVAVNVSAGKEFGYSLLWVLVAANVMAAVVQYLSAKLGVVSGRSLAELLGERLGRTSRLLYWAQAELVVLATDVAEIVGGALALYILFGLPLVAGAVLVGCASLGLLGLRGRGQKPFERVMFAMLAFITVGFSAGLVVSPLDPAAMLTGLIPRWEGSRALVLAVGILGATIMPHAVHVHSAQARDRHSVNTAGDIRRVLRGTVRDVSFALTIAGTGNAALLILAASNLNGTDNTEGILQAHAAIGANLGPVIAVVFALALLISGFASTAVGAHAGAEVMGGLLHTHVPVLLRRVIALAPSITILAAGIDPTAVLVLSQVLLSVGVPFALIPLVRLTGNSQVMGCYSNGRALRIIASAIAVIVVVLNLTLLGLSAIGT